MGLGRVLVVDDERPLARIVGSYLEREGFDVSVAHDGPSAVTAARQDMPILVVLDVMLPGADGITVCQELRTFTDAYILMLTARDGEPGQGRSALGRSRRLPREAVLLHRAGRPLPRHAASSPDPHPRLRRPA